MATLETRINEALQEVAADIKLAVDRDGSLASLNTTAKASLVAAINEVRSTAVNGSGSLKVTNNLSDLGDPASARSNLAVNSSTETASAITAAVAGVTLAGLGGATQSDINTAIAAVVGAAPAALDTLQEIAAEMANDDSAFAALTTTVSNKVGFTAAQTLTQIQKDQACANIGIGDPDTDFKTAYIATRDA